MNIVIVIVNWNTGNLLTKCLESIYSLPEGDMIRKIVVVDNASHDDSLQKAKSIESNKMHAEFIESKENLGFAGANNLAMTDLADREDFSDHVLLLNPDTEVKPGAIRAMADVFERNKKAGIVGPKLKNPDGTLQPSVRAFPSLPVMLVLILKLSRLVGSSKLWRTYLQKDLDYEKEQAVDQVMGAAFLIRNEVMKEIGGLDPKFWIWFEEVDYCKQAHNQNWQVIYTPKGEVLHYGGVSFDQVIGPKRVNPFLNSVIYYAKKNLSAPSWLLLNVLRPVAVLLSVPAALLHMQFKKKNEKRLAAK